RWRSPKPPCAWCGGSPASRSDRARAATRQGRARAGAAKDGRRREGERLVSPVGEQARLVVSRRRAVERLPAHGAAVPHLHRERLARRQRIEVQADAPAARDDRRGAVAPRMQAEAYRAAAAPVAESVARVAAA